MDFLNLAIESAVKAGKEIMKIYQRMNYQVIFKDDNSPLTLADRNSHRIVKELLSLSGLPIISEEDKVPSYHERREWKLFWMIDPLDGTKEFVSGNGEFTVNIALICCDKPILGDVYAPVFKEQYYASEKTGTKNVHLEADDSFRKVENLNLKSTI